ncbi:hypothetical protein B566_EDAN011771 [Ephemera danica]|nr:hypothetical protein B566_EDAN011771 [Ephemera danica]
MVDLPLMMYPQSPLPRHITALYLVAVVSLVVLCHAALAGADVLVFSQKTHKPIEDLDFHDLPARFGDRLPFEGLRPPNDTLPYAGKWIILIRRYDCSFEDKIRNAQRSGYDAAIVHNVNSSDLEPMSAKDAMDIYTPSVFVNEEAGLILKDNYQYKSGYYILINDDLPFNINTHLLLPFAIVVGVCFLITVVFMVVKCVKDYRRQRRHRLPSSSLRQIPTSKFTKGDPYETCAICLEDYIEGDKLRILPCVHAYHTKCIDPWLTRSRRVCPVCKRKVFARDERVTSDTESETDDETAPLVRSPSTPGVTGGGGGGTFSRQRDNPFRRAMRRRRDVPQLDDDSSSASSAEGVVSAATVTVEQEHDQRSNDNDSHSQMPDNAHDELTASSAEHSINSEPSEAVPVVAAESSGAEVAISVPTLSTGQVEVAIEARGSRQQGSPGSRSDINV